ncbi:NADP-dependent oxidoreductase domain-containing protein [Rhodocollybia butyracea]|uniref:NADP-dependent oxidoreductase domain-containing protein n=1 Tax=Rhodocollybia butyracea TaxID=206335 RepID=A0A9P5UCZ6_9AGAR|nr:NADP-dependent oxidoreductase domain-containing protein [Rhodocollybia butyracea]
MPFKPTDSATLSTGIKIPVIANGSWAPSTGNARAEAKDWTLTALKAGYRHIDTAQGYGTENSVGLAIKESGLKREEVFITTKLPFTDHDNVQQSFNESLENLGVDYVDLYLLHWPQFIRFDGTESRENAKAISSPTFSEVWFEIEKIFEQKKAKAIGVSNFSIKNLEILLKSAKVVPAANQVELHPYLAQNELREYCRSKGIVVVAYAPSGYSQVRNDPVIGQIAQEHNVTPNQVILGWHLARETVVVPKSQDVRRQRDNITLPVLSEDDVKKIDALDRGERICNKPDESGLVWGWSMEQLGW